MSDLKVTFRGVRGSHAMPGSTTIRYGGNTTCLEVRAGDQLIIIDAGTGIISLGKELMRNAGGKPIQCTLLFTHLHHDHNEGLPFFQPVYLPSSRIDMFGPDPLEEDIGRVLFQSPYFPVDLDELPAVKVLTSLLLADTIVFEENRPRLINSNRTKIALEQQAVYVRVLRGKSHPRQGIYIYRVYCGDKSVVFATDTEGYIGGDARLIRFAEGADLLIHDAQYSMEDYTGGAVPKQGFGHSTPEMAIEVARKAGVKQVALTHHDPDSTDDMLDKIEAEAREQWGQAFLAREGMVIEL